jgi:hypothetical protein
LRKEEHKMEFGVERMEDVVAAESIWYHIGYAVGSFVRSLLS